MQLELYPEGPGYAKGRATSCAAAAQLTDISPNEQLVIDALRDGSKTDYELRDFIKKDMNQVQPRRSTLTARGLIVDSGERRLTPYNRMAIVWKLL